MRSLPILFIAFASAAASPVDFNRDVQPLLSENCFHCHGQDANKREADLRLDRKDGLYRAADGVTIVKPGDVANSELLTRIFSTDRDDVMPPPKSHRSLTDAQKQTLKRWVEEGAPWSEHWAFVAPRKPAGDSIDEFVRARLAKEGLKPSPEADRARLIRRVTFDLTGLPPTTEEADAFVADPSPQAYEKVVERLLASPRYGERWAWDWLDAARYADTNGYQGDPERTMWPWRDWVTKAINANMPYDQFTIWQLAGDLLPHATPEQKLATGFHRNHMMNGEGGRIAEETRVENVFDRVETTGMVWMGLTVGCCRCHDHKFDPLSQRDYFALYDFFNQTSETGQGRGGQATPALDMSTPAEVERNKKAEEKVAAVAAEVDAFELTKFPRPEGKPLSESAAINLPGNLSATLAKTEPKKRGVDALLESIAYFKDKDADYTKQLDKLLKAVRERDTAGKNITRVMIMDTLKEPRATFILSKGAYDKPTDVKVTAGTPASLPAMSTDAQRDRLGLARWLVASENPLTARVTVNRFWQAFFGTGLVKTVEDFGVQGEKPSHPEMLDWLAVQFVESGWDVKALHKLIVTSATYRQSSRVTPQLVERDPENRLLARGPRFRLPSWMLRDQALAISGLLVDKPGGPAVMPYQPEGIWEEATFGKKSYKQDHGESLYRRSLYTFWRRIVGPTMFFDNTSRQTCYVRSILTNTPLHALTTLNETTYVEAARMLAQRVMLAGKDDAARLRQVFKLAVARDIQPEESALLLKRLDALKAQFHANTDGAQKLLSVGESKRDESLAPAEHAAWTALCQLVLNLDETITKP
ncbi:MAG: PSD1 and planctomycete cytochrome C domain-containing protein [Chthoniobacteraceae bacterium]